MKIVYIFNSIRYILFLLLLGFFTGLLILVTFFLEKEIHFFAISVALVLLMMNITLWYGFILKLKEHSYNMDNPKERNPNVLDDTFIHKNEL